MKKVKIGIMPREQYQKRMIDIAAGRLKPNRGEPKVWFHSMKSLCEVLSEKNVELLQTIMEQEPETISELADITGRQPSNLGRTLKTLEFYGFVELKKHNKTKRPIAKSAAFDIQYGAHVV